MRSWRGPALLLALALSLSIPLAAQTGADDTLESAYAPSTLAKIFGGNARSLNDEAELAPAGEWYRTTATFTGRTRQPSGRLRPLINAWTSSRGEPRDDVELYFSGDLPELEFEQDGRKYWVMAGLPGGLGFDVYRAGQRLTIFVQRIGFSSGTPVAMLRLVKFPEDGGARAPSGRLRNARVGEGARRQEAVFRSGSATFNYAGREFTLPLDASGRHSVAPGLYRYENGVRTALLEYGGGDDRYLLLRVSVPDGGAAPDVVPYLVLNGRIVPPIDLGACRLDIPRVDRGGVRGSIDCSGVARAVLRDLAFTAE